MDSILYNEILTDYFIPFASRAYGIKNFNLHQDNDPKHSSKICTNFLERNQIKWIKAPANSPDLNPIEWLWAGLKICLENSEFRPKTEEEITIMIRFVEIISSLL